MVKTKKQWREISFEKFVDEVGEGKERCLIDTKYVRIFYQSFLSGTHVKCHNHSKTKEWEVVIAPWIGLFAIYSPKMEHDLFGPPLPRDTWWSIISIKIGKKP